MVPVMKSKEGQCSEKTGELRFRRSTVKTISILVEFLKKQSDVIEQHSEQIRLLDRKLAATRRLLVIVSLLASMTLLVQLVHLWLLLLTK